MNRDERFRSGEHVRLPRSVPSDGGAPGSAVPSSTSFASSTAQSAEDLLQDPEGVTDQRTKGKV